jgi:hypothetical protein
VKRLLLLGVLMACGKADPPPVPAGVVKIDEPVLRTDTVGLGDQATAATFVLVDATNTSPETHDITLGGDLVDATGAVVGHLRTETLTIQAGASRTFALVDDKDAARPTATGAKLRPIAAGKSGPPPPVTLTDGHAFDDHGKVMVAASLTNKGDQPAQVLVLSSFHDATGKPMLRPFELILLQPGEVRTVRYEGPDGSKDGSIYLGAENY